MEIPAGLASSAGFYGATGQLWLAALPGVVDELCDRWGINLDRIRHSVHVSFVASVRRSNGTPAVLKVPMAVELDQPAAHARASEPDALRAWAGRGAVQLLAHDDDSGAMLLEEATPGACLSEGIDLDEADEVAAALLPQLWRRPSVPGRFLRLQDLAAEMASRSQRRYDALGRPFEAGLLADALDAQAFLAAAQPECVLIHGDLHHDNVVSSRRGWLAIDPLPMIGERDYDAVQFLLFRKGSMDDPVSGWGPAIRRFTELVGVDPVRVKAWTLLRLVSDALASSTEGSTTAHELEAVQGDLWSARLIRRLT